MLCPILLGMTATDQQILNEAKDSLLRILQSDTSSWSEFQRSQQQIQIKQLQDLIDRYETKTAASAGRQPFMGIRRTHS